MSVLRNRILASMSLATGTQQRTPSEAYFVDTNAIGRWGGDYEVGVHAPAYVHRRHSDGTCDTVYVHPIAGGYSELGGQGGRDIAVGRI
jgi:hypothetical protein